MGRALYSSEVQQPERTTPALCDRGQAEQPGEAAAVLGRAYVLHPDGHSPAVCPLRARCGSQDRYSAATHGQPKMAADLRRAGH
jgi:hypothetical protein